MRKSHSILSGLLCVSLALSLSACDNDVDGTLRVFSPITFQDHKGRDFTITSSRKINVDPENVGDVGEEEIKLKFKDDSGKDRKVVLRVPEDQSIPENGTLYLRGSQIGQSFDLETAIQTVRTRGPQEHSYEHCTYTTTEYVCWHTPHGQQCGYQTVQRQGYRPVIQHLETIDVSAESRFLDPSSRQVLASFDGARYDQYWVTEWMGSCGW